MIKKIDHITFAVRNRQETGERLKEVYGAKFMMNVDSEAGQYTCDIYNLADGMIIGLLESTSKEGFVAKHLELHGDSLQHIGVDVENLDSAMQTFSKHGIKYSQYGEIEGVRKEVLVSAKNGFGAVLQVMEWLGDYKEANSVDRMKKAWDGKINV